MPIKRIIMVHGIGNQTDASFADGWREAILDAFPQLKNQIVFKALYWEDLRQEAEKKWPPVDPGLAKALESFGLPQLQQTLDGDNYKMMESFATDVVNYVGIPEATLYFLNGCLARLEELSAGQETETLIIAHSLGAAMIPHALWRLRENTRTIPYHSLILLASPLGFNSPIEWTLGDFLNAMGKITGTDRKTTLGNFAKAWSRTGDRRLHFIRNTNDIVCNDARFQVAGASIDIIPLIEQGFSEEEVALLEAAHEGCHHFVTFGGDDVSLIGDNHDVLNYIKQKAFKDVLGELLNA